jgi:Cu/Ag efflux protein CusF
MRHIAILAVVVFGLSQLVTAQEASKLREPGGALTIGATGSATVKAIDADKRVVTLQTADGDTVQIKCAPQVRNFDQIKVGDQVKAAAVARLVVAVGKDATAGDQTGTIIARAPKGAKPGAIIAKTEEVTAKVDAVDPAKQTVTLSGIDDQPQTVQVAPDVDLSGVKQGDDVVVRVTKGIALWVAQPQEGQSAAEPAKAEAEPAAFAIEGATATATVDAIDPAKRIVTLKAADGTTRSIHLGKECVNFDQIKVGDQVRSTVAEEVAVSVSKAGTPPSAGTGAVIALAPKGAKPGMLIADTEDVTAKIKSIDAQKGTITLSEADGTSRTIKAGPDVKLSELKEGDDVTARITQAMAIVVQKP